jgi:hypothetical protein
MNYNIVNYVAIDPGASGGIAWTEPDRSVQAIAMPETVVDIADHLRYLFVQAGCRTAFLEEIPKFAGPNASAIIKLGIRYGEIRGILATLGLRVVELPPKSWQKTLGLGGSKGHGTRWKSHLKEKAQAFYPHLAVTLKTADALLILEAGRKLL